jgi:hypothetical protein
MLRLRRPSVGRPLRRGRQRAKARAASRAMRVPVGPWCAGRSASALRKLRDQLPAASLHERATPSAPTPPPSSPASSTSAERPAIRRRAPRAKPAARRRAARTSPLHTARAKNAPVPSATPSAATPSVGLLRQSPRSHAGKATLSLLRRRLLRRLLHLRKAARARVPFRRLMTRLGRIL